MEGQGLCAGCGGWTGDGSYWGRAEAGVVSLSDSAESRGRRDGAMRGTVGGPMSDSSSVTPACYNLDLGKLWMASLSHCSSSEKKGWFKYDLLSTFHLFGL